MKIQLSEEEEYNQRQWKLRQLSLPELKDMIISNIFYDKEQCIDIILDCEWDLDNEPKRELDLAIFGKINFTGILDSIQDICKDYKFKQIGNKIIHQKK